jgi:hypothetical protein
MTLSEVAAPRLVLDAGEYAQRVLLQGADVPWEPTAHARLVAQIGALLRPDLSLVDLGAFVAAAIEERPAVRERMAGARRPTAALRALLADDALAEDAVAVVRVVVAMSPVPVAVQIPSPAAWLAAVAGTARDHEFDEDDAENASIYLADWVRRFSALSVDTLLLDGRGAPREESLDSYGPLLGLADHYRWTLGLRRRDALDLASGGGGVLDGAFWSGASIAQPRDVALVISRIDPEARPETVLHARQRWH